MIQESVEISSDESKILDRQIRLWGIECQKKIKSARLIVYSYSSICQEILKNMLLSGIGYVDLIIGCKKIETGWFFPNSTINYDKQLMNQLLEINPSLKINLIEFNEFITRSDKEIGQIIFLIDFKSTFDGNMKMIKDDLCNCFVVCDQHKHVSFSFVFSKLPDIEKWLRIISHSEFKLQSIISKNILPESIFFILVYVNLFIRNYVEELKQADQYLNTPLNDDNSNDKMEKMYEQIKIDFDSKKEAEIKNYIESIENSLKANLSSYYHGSSIIAGLITKNLIQILDGKKINVLNDNLLKSYQSDNVIVYDGYNNHCYAYDIPL